MQLTTVKLLPGAREAYGVIVIKIGILNNYEEET
jgi:hypothetical protein